MVTVDGIDNAVTPEKSAGVSISSSVAGGLRIARLQGNEQFRIDSSDCRLAANHLTIGRDPVEW